MGGDARQTPASVRYRPHIWLTVASWAMTPIFGLLAFGSALVDPTVDIDCRRQDGQTRCDVVTEGLLSPSVARLSDADLRGARIALSPEPHDQSFKKVELRRDASVQQLADFSQSTRRQAVSEVNGFLDDVSSGPIAARVVDPGRSPWQRFGLFPFQLIGLVLLAIGVYSLGRRTTLTAVDGELEVRRARWPWPAQIQRWPLREIAGIEVVSRIPKDLAPIVASLPWRNIYRANALALRTTAGDEVLITDLCKRSRARHEQMAATMRGWL